MYFSSSIMGELRGHYVVNFFDTIHISNFNIDKFSKLSIKFNISYEVTCCDCRVALEVCDNNI